MIFRQVTAFYDVHFLKGAALLKHCFLNLRRQTRKLFFILGREIARYKIFSLENGPVNLHAFIDLSHDAFLIVQNTPEYYST